MADNPIPLVDPHQHTLELLPFLANGTLAGSERDEVERHLQGCATCRAELALEQRTVRAFRTMEPMSAAGDEGFARILARTRSTTVTPPARRWRGAPRVLSYALAASLAGVVVGAVWWQGGARPGAADVGYHTLSQDRGRAVGNDIVYVKFAADVSVAAAGAILGALHADTVGGPNADSVFTVRAGADGVAATVAALSRRPEVVFAAPAAPGAPR